MYSPLIRVILAMIGLSPILFSLYVVKTINDYKNIALYFRFRSFQEFSKGVADFFAVNYLLLLFLLLILAARGIVRKAKRDLTIGRIDVKSIKPGDSNFVTLLFSVILPFYKFPNPSFSDTIYIGGFFIVAIAYGLTMKSSYHFNIVLKLFLGYNHYEVATTGEVTYLMLSKNKLVNRNQVKEYVPLTDHMLINMTEKIKNHGR